MIDGKIVAKLCDLGIAKSSLTESDMKKSLKTNVGTYTYKAPEFFELEDRKIHCYDISVDVFSAGLLISAFIDVEDNKEIQPPTCKLINCGRGF